MKERGQEVNTLEEFGNFTKKDQRGRRVRERKKKRRDNERSQSKVIVKEVVCTKCKKCECE